MGGAIIKRLIVAVPMLIGSSIIVFMILRLVPGDPASAVLGADATPQLVRQVREQLGLDHPIYAQYVSWLGGVLHGSFGHDYISDQSIASELASRLPVTMELAGLAFLISAACAIPLGVFAAVHFGRPTDRSVQVISAVGVAVPNFVLGIMGILVFSLALGLVPSSGFVPLSQSVAGNLHSLILPAAALAAGLAGVLTRITRATMVEVLDTDYIRFARARGVRQSSLVFKHALRNAAIPIVTVAGLQLGYLLGATVIIEQVFSIPGVGQLVVQAMLNRDYPVVQACVLVFVVAFVIVNLAADLAYTVLNPKLRRAGA